MGTPLIKLRPNPAISEFQSWLSKKGSPKSRIDKMTTKSLTSVEKSEFNDFTIRR